LAGIVTVALKLPDVLVVIVSGEVTSAFVSNFIVTVLLALKPEPEIMTALPPIPAVGDSVIVPDVVILNVTEPVFPEASVAAIV